MSNSLKIYWITSPIYLHSSRWPAHLAKYSSASRTLNRTYGERRQTPTLARVQSALSRSGAFLLSWDLLCRGMMTFLPPPTTEHSISQILAAQSQTWKIISVSGLRSLSKLWHYQPTKGTCHTPSLSLSVSLPKESVLQLSLLFHLKEARHINLKVSF